MPTKERNARPTRAGRLPGHEYLQVLKALDFNAPAGKWEIDKPLGEILEKGLARGIAGSRRPYWIVRHHAVGCVRSAFIGAKVAYHRNADRPRQREEIKSLEELSSSLEAFMVHTKELDALLTEYQFPPKARRKLLQLRAAKEAEAFYRKLSSLISDMRPSAASRGNAKDHLADLFVQGMRDLWQHVCSEPAPHGGGRLLVSLSAATCRDARIMLEHDADGGLEDWLSVKFRTQNWPS
jgi:hypothetical protein